MTTLPQPDPSNDDFTKNLTGVNIYDFEKPKKRIFFPWHRPRKQYVRERQWTRLIEQLLEDYHPESKIVKYLGLPGDDLLDLRHFHDAVCVPKEIKLRFLGFNKGMRPGPEHESSLEISLDEINRLPYVDNRSELLPDDFVNISGENSLAWAKSKDMGPFDVINIDLCDSFGKEVPGQFAQNQYNTLHKLMMFQSQRKEPWLLFLTTRSNLSSVNARVFGKLKKIYLENLTNCNGFLEKSKSTFSVESEDTLNEFCKREDGFSNIFLTGLSKWILNIGLAQSPQSYVEIKNVMGYKVFQLATSPDLISIALQINPTMSFPTDKIGLAQHNNSLLDECSKAIEMLEQLSSQQNVDDILNANIDLKDEMIRNTCSLLEKARYDISGYDSWLKKRD